jgi:hypothetical protein
MADMVGAMSAVLKELPIGAGWWALLQAALLGQKAVNAVAKENLRRVEESMKTLPPPLNSITLPTQHFAVSKGTRGTFLQVSIPVEKTLEVVKELSKFLESHVSTQKPECGREEGAPQEQELEVGAGGVDMEPATRENLPDESLVSVPLLHEEGSAGATRSDEVVSG